MLNADSAISAAAEAVHRDNSLKPRILLADDHFLIAEALSMLLASHFDVVGVITDAKLVAERGCETPAGGRAARRDDARIEWVGRRANNFRADAEHQNRVFNDACQSGDPEGSIGGRRLCLHCEKLRRKRSCLCGEDRAERWYLYFARGQGKT